MLASARTVPAMHKPTPKLCRLSWRRLIISRLPQNFLNSREEIHRHRKHDSRILLDSDLRQRLQIAQLNADRLARKQMCGVDQPLRRRELAFGVNDLRSLLAFRFG